MRSKSLAALTAALLSAAGLVAQGQPPGAPGRPAEARPAALVQPAPAAPAPKASLTLYERHGHVTPRRQGFQHTGAGNIDVSQTSPDTVVITMAGVAVAGPHPWKDSTAAMDFDLTQCFEVSVDRAEVKAVKLTLEARVIGLLRSGHCSKGLAEESGGCATVTAGPAAVVTVCAPPHSVGCGESLSINDHEGPVTAPVAVGKYTLHQTFHVGVSNPHGLCGKASSSEFAPDPALDPLWISYWEPFHGAAKKDFGFQVTLKVATD
jgi:hypothetical protein